MDTAEIAIDPPSDHAAYGTDPRRRRRDPQATKVKNGSRNGAAVIAGVRTSTYVRRFRELMADFEHDIPNATVAEHSLMRCAAILKIELESLETKFAAAGEAGKKDLISMAASQAICVGY